jgi:hypothetical protein
MELLLYLIVTLFMVIVGYFIYGDIFCCNHIVALFWVMEIIKPIPLYHDMF